MRRWKGFLTLTAMVVLAVCAGSLAIATSSLGQSVRTLERTSARITDRARAMAKVTEIIDALDHDWDSRRESWVDFVGRFPVDRDTKLIVTDLSGRLNLNNIHRFLISDSSLAGTSRGHSLAELWEYRRKEGPFSDLSAYQGYFAEGALASLYTALPVYFLQTVDETILEKVTAVRTGDSGLAVVWRNKLQKLRGENAPAQSYEPASFFGSGSASVAALFSGDAEINANTAPDALLEALLRYPAFEIPEPTSKLAALLTARKSQRLTMSSLQSMTQLPASHRLWAYLGTESRFLEATLSLPATKLRVQLWRRPQATGDGVQILKLRTMEP